MLARDFISESIKDPLILYQELILYFVTKHYGGDFSIPTQELLDFETADDIRVVGTPDIIHLIALTETTRDNH